MTTLHSDSLKEAGRLLNRLRPKRAALPVLSHVLADAGANGVTLAVPSLDQWLETRVPPAGPADSTAAFLIPPEAFAAG